MSLEDLYIGCLVDAWYHGNKKHGKVMDLYYNDRDRDQKIKGWWFLVATDFNLGTWRTVEVHETDLVL